MIAKLAPPIAAMLLASTAISDKAEAANGDSAEDPDMPCGMYDYLHPDHPINCINQQAVNDVDRGTDRVIR